MKLVVSARESIDWIAYLYILPAFLVVGLFHIVPVFTCLSLSLYEDVSIYTSRFVGLANFRQLAVDSQFRDSLVNTLWFVLGTVPTAVVLSLFVAILLDTEIRGRGIYRTIYFLPVITSVAAISLVWKWVYNAEYGLLNHLFGWQGFDWLQQNDGLFLLCSRKLGLGLPAWFPVGPSVAMLAVIALSVWKGLGYNVVIFLAGLQTIPRELYEVARIDGASAWQSFRNVTWPLLTPTTYFILVMTTISSFQVFTQIYMLYDGIPADSARVVVFYLYETAFRSDRLGYASAIAYVLFGIIFALTMVQRRIAGSQVHYQ